MRKCISFLLIFALILTLSGCSCRNKDKSDIPTPAAPEASDAIVPTEEVETENAQTAAEIESIIEDGKEENESRDDAAEDKTEDPEQSTEGAQTTADETNYLTTYGRVVHYQDYTYFVQQALDNDGSENGHAGSENLYRISDDEDAEPECLLSVPSRYFDGIQQMTIFFLVPYENYVYFVWDNHVDDTDYAVRDVFCRLDMNTGEITEYDLQIFGTMRWVNAFSRSGDKLYMKAPPETSEEYASNTSHGLVEFDLKDGSYDLFQPDFKLPEKETAEIIRVTDKYVYYVKYVLDDDEGLPYGVCRFDRMTGNSEDVCAISDTDTEIIMYTNGCICLLEDGEKERIVFIDPESGKESAALNLEDLCSDLIFTVSAQTIYYFDRNNDLCMQELREDAEKTALMPGGDRVEPMLISASDDWIWYMNDDDNGMYRVKKTGRILPGSPVVPAITWEDRYEEKDSDDFGFTEYPKCIGIRGYNGSAETVTIPETIQGKPVKIVSWWAYNHDGKNVKTLYIPEGVVSIGAIEDRTIQEVYLPSTVKHFCSHGYKYTFSIQNGGTLYYNGTIGEWEDVCAFSRSYHDVATDTSGTENLTVICTDGTWVPEE